MERQLLMPGYLYFAEAKKRTAEQENELEETLLAGRIQDRKIFRFHSMVKRRYV